MLGRTLIFLCLLAAIGAASCNRKADAPVFSARDSLLGNWSRVLRAYDYNGNQHLDSAEIKYAPATDTFLLSLSADASYQRVLTFKSVQFPESGTWHLQSNSTEIVFQPSTSTSVVDTFQFDTLSQSYLRFHRISGNDVWYWEDYRRPR
ncbi:MAG: hypothetical protein JST36_01830 [Bacteroidetes bacterium]|nr:hypothetical protein [Bacteroidota bacterium]